MNDGADSLAVVNISFNTVFDTPLKDVSTVITSLERLLNELLHQMGI